jgi:hypothetical protein
MKSLVHRLHGFLWFSSHGKNKLFLMRGNEETKRVGGWGNTNKHGSSLSIPQPSLLFFFLISSNSQKNVLFEFTFAYFLHSLHALYIFPVCLAGTESYPFISLDPLHIKPPH